MAKCSVCNKRGLFLRVNDDGLCNECEIKRQQQIVQLQQEEKRKREAEELDRRQRREEFLRRKLLEAQAELNSLPCFDISISSEKRKRQSGYEGIKTSNITPKGNYSEFVVLDTETTGLAPSKDRIIELAAIRFENGIPIERFETLVNPEKEIPQEVVSINHITNSMVQNAPNISQILPAFEAFIGNSPVVAHNLEFDLKFLFYSGCSIINGKRKFYDTLEQAQKMLKKPRTVYDREYGVWETDYESDYDVVDYKLETLCEYYNITIPCQHRAAADALVTGKLFLKLVSERQSS